MLALILSCPQVELQGVDPVAVALAARPPAGSGGTPSDRLAYCVHRVLRAVRERVEEQQQRGDNATAAQVRAVPSKAPAVAVQCRSWTCGRWGCCVLL